MAVAALLEARRRLPVLMNTRPLDCILAEKWRGRCVYERDRIRHPDETPIARRALAGDLAVLESLPTIELDWIACDAAKARDGRAFKFRDDTWVVLP